MSGAGDDPGSLALGLLAEAVGEGRTPGGAVVVVDEAGARRGRVGAIDAAGRRPVHGGCVVALGELSRLVLVIAGRRLAARVGLDRPLEEGPSVRALLDAAGGLVDPLGGEGQPSLAAWRATADRWLGYGSGEGAGARFRSSTGDALAADELGRAAGRPWPALARTLLRELGVREPAVEADELVGRDLLTRVQPAGPVDAAARGLHVELDGIATLLAAGAGIDGWWPSATRPGLGVLDDDDAGIAGWADGRARLVVVAPAPGVAAGIAHRVLDAVRPAPVGDGAPVPDELVGAWVGALGAAVLGQGASVPEVQDLSADRGELVLVSPSSVGGWVVELHQPDGPPVYGALAGVSGHPGAAVVVDGDAAGRELVVAGPDAITVGGRPRFRLAR